MTKSRRISILFFFALAILALIYLAAALPGMVFEPGEPFPFSLFSGGFGRAPFGAAAPSGDGNLLRIAAILIFWIGLPLSIIYLILSPDARRRFMRLLPTFFLLLFLLYWFSNLEREPREQEVESIGLGQGEFAETSLPPVPEFVADPPEWLVFGVNILLTLLFVAVALFLWRFFSRRQQEDTHALIIKEAQRAISDIQAGGDLKNVIIRCYAEMSDLLQKEKHVKRRRGMTAREFESHLAHIGIDDGHINRLTRLFEQVRYSTNTLGPRQEREAVDCLNAIVRAYGSPPGETA